MVLLSIIKLKAPIPILIADRFYPALGWIEIIAFGAYSARLASVISNKKNAVGWIKTRKTIWLFFSIIFFSQLFLGLIGFHKFLMSGKLHLPIPVMIIAGPVFRESGFFMPILFLSTLFIVGPAWCSWLCYFGAWDLFAASKKGISVKPQQLP